MADAKTIGMAQFAGVNNLAVFAQQLIEARKLEARVLWIAEGRDDMAAVGFGFAIGLEAERTHPLYGHLAIAGVAGCATCHPSLLGQLGQRLMKGQQALNRWCKTKLAILFQSFVLSK